MFSCFSCKKKISNIQELFRHLRVNHALYDGHKLELICCNPSCSHSYQTFSGYRKHLLKCIRKPDISNPPLIPQKNTHIQESVIGNVINFNESITSFQENLIGDYFRDYVLKLYSLNLPDTTIQTIFEWTDDLLNHIKSFPNEDATSCFRNFSTKYKRSQYFKNAVVNPKEIVIGLRYDKNWSNIANSYIQVPVTCTFSYVPIQDTLKFLACNSSVLQFLCRKRSKSFFIKEITDGTCFRNNNLYKSNEIAFQLHLFFDEFETVNPLGSKTGGHKIGAIYMIIRNIPPEFNSAIQNIHLVALFYSSDVKMFGFNSILKIIVDDIKVLEAEGIFLEKLDRNIRGTVVAISHDNLGGNQLFGMVESFVANYFCRICIAEKGLTKSLCKEDKTLLRTNDLYEAHSCETAKNSYGIKTRSYLNELQFFKLCENPSVDIMHDMLEGVIQLELKLFLKFIVSEHLITIEHFNDRLKSFDFGIENSSNQPSPVSLDKSGNLIGQRAAQTWCLIRFFPLIIYDIINIFSVEHSEKYEVILILIEITSIVFCPVSSSGLASKLQVLIENHHELFLTRMNHHLIPKHHLMIHYPDIIRKMGPLVGLWSMRFESKHAYFKHLIHSLKNFKAVCKTLSTRHQTHMWNIWRNINLSLEPIYGKSFLKNISKELYQEELQILLNTKLLNLKFTKSVKAFGSTFRLNSFVTTEMNEYNMCPIFCKIFAICVLDTSNPIFLCESWITKCFDDKSQSYIVEESVRLNYKLICLKNLKHMVAYDLSTPYKEKFYCIVPKYKIILE